MIKKIGPFSFEAFVTRVEAFHGFSAPGVVLGGVMVTATLGRLPEGILFDAVCETDKCLPDAVQLLTPCTIGNGWLRIQPWGRFALALYDKESGTGVRTVLDPARLEECPELKAWFYKLKPKEETDPKQLLAAIQEEGETLCRLQEIQIHPAFMTKTPRGKRIICPQCQEAYPDYGNGLCPACSGAARAVYQD